MKPRNHDFHYFTPAAIGCLFLLLLLPLLWTSAQESAPQIIPEPEAESTKILTPGDRISIGYVDVGRQGNLIEKTMTTRIKEDGTIFHELLGVVKLSGMTISEAESLLFSEFSRYYTNPKVNIVIVEQTKYKVLLYGEVHRVGIYLVNPNTRVAEFIIENGGTTADADLKNIRISRSDGTTLNFNMDRYLYTNNPVNNVVLRDFDKVIIPKVEAIEQFTSASDNYILQYGNVLEITVSEISETVYNPAQKEVYIVDRNGNIYHRLFGMVHLGGASVDRAEAILMEMAKRVYSNPLVTIEVVDISSRNVFVYGEVSRPGIYPLEGNIRIAEFLAVIGGFLPTADIRKITITREEGRTVTFNFKKFLFDRDDSENIYLEDGDRIIVLPQKRGFWYKLAEQL